MSLKKVLLNITIKKKTDYEKAISLQFSFVQLMDH